MTAIQLTPNHIIVNDRAYSPSDGVPVQRVREAYQRISNDIVKAVLGPNARFSAYSPVADALTDAPHITPAALIAKCPSPEAKRWLEISYKNELNSPQQPWDVFSKALSQGTWLLAANEPRYPDQTAQDRINETYIDAKNYRSIFVDDRLELGEAAPMNSSFNPPKRTTSLGHAQIGVMALLIDEAKARR